MVYKNFYCVLILLFLCSCSKEITNIPSEPIFIKKILTIYLIDVSGSYNKTQTKGKFENENFFELSCKQIIDHVNNATFGKEHIFIRQISDESHGEEAFIGQFNLCDTNMIYNKPKPKNPYKLNSWRTDSIKFIKDVEKLVCNKRESLLNSFHEFENKMVMNPSEYTDLINAFRTCERDVDYFKQQKYSIIIIVYSDFEETKTKLRNQKINLSGIKIIGKGVPVSRWTPNKYQQLYDDWNNAINCDTLIFVNPEYTFTK
ncbi:MAG: hypothetical protein ISS16_03305 [Ignavibacteria bacterium]|nr:hypothetical protein [Ignavibacteria bacterium]